MKVQLTNPDSGEIKSLKVGWSWTIFFFAAIGIPLFIRGLHGWGVLMIGLTITEPVLNYITKTSDNSSIAILLTALVLIDLSLWIYLSIKGNAIAAKKYFENGWVFVNPEGDIEKIAREAWNIK